MDISLTRLSEGVAYANKSTLDNVIFICEVEGIRVSHWTSDLRVIQAHITYEVITKAEENPIFGAIDKLMELAMEQH